MARLALSGGVTQVVLEGGGRALAGHLRRAHGHRAEVGCHVRHARVLPIDEADVAVFVHQEVRGEEVVVRGDFIEAVRVCEGLETQDLVAQLKVSGHVDRAEGLQEALVAQAFGDEVEGTVQDSAGGVQGAVHLHGRFQFFEAGHVQVTHVAHERESFHPAAGSPVMKVSSMPSSAARRKAANSALRSTILSVPMPG